MKKSIILCIVILNVVACSSYLGGLFIEKSSTKDEPETKVKLETITTDETEIKNLILGFWTLDSNIENGVDKTTPCTKQSTFIFSKEGTFMEFRYINLHGVCEKKCSRQNTWKHIGENNLVLNFGQDISLNFKLIAFKSAVGVEYFLVETIEKNKTLKKCKTYKKI